MHSQITEDPAAVAAAIVADILAAKTIDDVFAQQDTTHAEDILGERLMVRSVKWLGSDKADGPGFYSLLDAVDDAGTVRLVTCGARSVMAQLFRLQELNAFPLYVAIVQADRATAAGYFPMRLEPRTAPA